MELLTLVYVLLILAFAKAVGEVVSRANQPSVVGELLAGIILGPFLLGAVFTGLGDMYSEDSEPGTFISALADFGMLFLMLYAGLEFSPRLIRSSSWLGGAVAAIGVAVPMVLGFFVGMLFDLSGSTLLFVAVALSVTALPVTVRVLKDLEVMKTRTSGIIVSAALISDAALLLVLGIILGSVGETPSATKVLYLAAGFIFFFAMAIVIGRFVVPYVYKLLRWMRTGEAAFAVAVGFAIAFAILAERVGLPAIIGAFIAGLLLRETGTGLKVWARVEDILSGVTLGFLAPIFFVLIGFSVQFDTVAENLPLLGAVTAVAMAGKILGSYLPARVYGLSSNESMAIGSMMMGKGAMELVFARLALEQDPPLIGQDLFSILVIMAFVSTLLAPVLFKYFFNRAVASGAIPPEEPQLGEKAHPAP